MTNDVGAALSCALVVVGDRLGLYRALATHGPIRSADLAAKLDLSPRMVGEWLLNQAAAGYISYQPGEQRYVLSPEQEALLADEDSPTFLAGAYQFATAMTKAEERVGEVFRTGQACAGASTIRTCSPGWPASPDPSTPSCSATPSSPRWRVWPSIWRREP
jgi:hypothetical protein